MRRKGHTEIARRLPGEHIQVSKQERLLEYDEWERENSLPRSTSMTECVEARASACSVGFSRRLRSIVLLPIARKVEKWGQPALSQGARHARNVQLRLTANSSEVHPFRAKGVAGEQAEFDFPQQATGSGALTLEWTRTPGLGGNGRGTQVSEVWLIKVAK